MTYRTKMIIPIVGLILVIGYAAIRVVSGSDDDIKQPLPATLSNLADVKSIEIRDASGQVVLAGSFSESTDVGGERERFAQLSPTGVDADAKGAAEVEIKTGAGAIAEQELEIGIEHLAAGASFKLFIDGQEVTSFTTNSRGEAELEMSNEPSK
jgi:hypothetical protein